MLMNVLNIMWWPMSFLCLSFSCFTDLLFPILTHTSRLYFQTRLINLKPKTSRGKWRRLASRRQTYHLAEIAVRENQVCRVVKEKNKRNCLAPALLNVQLDLIFPPSSLEARAGKSLWFLFRFFLLFPYLFILSSFFSFTFIETSPQNLHGREPTARYVNSN